MVRKIFEDNPELAVASLKFKSKEDLENYLKDNDETYKSILNRIVYYDKPAEKYLEQAVNKWVYQKEYLATLKLIEKGLEYNNPNTNPYLYRLRAECNLYQKKYKQALNDIKTAIAIVDKTNPDNDYILFISYETSVGIKQAIGDKNGGMFDQRQYKIYEAKLDSKYSSK